MASNRALMAGATVVWASHAYMGGQCGHQQPWLPMHEGWGTGPHLSVMALCRSTVGMLASFMMAAAAGLSTPLMTASMVASQSIGEVMPKMSFAPTEVAYACMHTQEDREGVRVGRAADGSTQVRADGSGRCGVIGARGKQLPVTEQL